MGTRKKMLIADILIFGLVWGVLWFTGDFDKYKILLITITIAVGASWFIGACIENSKAFHYSMITVLVILAVVLAGILIGILIRHYWLIFFVWLVLPFTARWLAGDIMRHHLSLQQHKMARGVLVGSAIVLAFINLVNARDLQFDFGKRFIDGYKITIVHDCEADSDAIQDQGLVAGALPGTCKEEILSEVAWYWRWFLRLSKWGYAIIAFIIFAGTVLICNSTVNRKAEEVWHENHPDGERFSLVKK